MVNHGEVVQGLQLHRFFECFKCFLNAATSVNIHKQTVFSPIETTADFQLANEGIGVENKISLASTRRIPGGGLFSAVGSPLSTGGGLFSAVGSLVFTVAASSRW